MLHKKGLFFALVAALLVFPPVADAQVMAFYKRGQRVIKRARPVPDSGLTIKTSSNPSMLIPYRVVQGTPLYIPRSAARASYQGPLAESILLRHALKQQQKHAPKVHTVFPGKEQIDAVIFDMDGTLLDSLPTWGNACADYLRTRGIDLPEDMNQAIKKMSLREGAQYLKEQFNLAEPVEELIEAALWQIRQHYATDILAKPGAFALLVHLKQQGIKICVATSSDQEFARLAFERLGFMPYIDFIISCDDVGRGKYSPAIYEEAVKRLGVSKTRTLVVEDALYALQTAKTAGFPTAGVADRYHSVQHEQEVSAMADYFFTSLEYNLE